MKMRKLMFIAAMLFSLSLSAQDLTIIHFNDTHSHIEPERGGEFDGHGGVIEQAAYVDSVRYAEGNSNVMLLHAGDFSQGTSYFTKFGGNIEVDLINALRFDVLCLGNHEFDNGIDELARRVRTIKSPVVCANYDFSNTPLDGLVKPWTVVEKAGKKIGVIGLLTDLSSVVSREIAVQLKYQHPAEVADRYGKELKDMGCDLVIALTHLGYEGGQYYTDQELASHTRYVDVIVGGHSHTYLTEMKTVRNLDGSEVKIVTDGKWGLNVGKLSVDFQPNRLTALYEQLKNSDYLPHDSSWFPYPAYDDREGWNAVLDNHAGYLIRAGEKYLGYKWQSVDATAYLAYERTGEREVMQTPLKENRVALNTLLMAELAEGKGRFIDQLINGTWHLSHTPSWVLSAHLPRQKTGRSLPDPAQQIIDLGSGALGAQMSVAYHFFHEEFDKVDPVISRVLKGAIKKQILDPYLEPANQRPNWWLAYDLKPGQVVNNWNPWCNADVILCFLLIEDDHQRLEHAVRQSLKSVDKFLAYVKTDGACEEGPAYWGHAAGKLYDYLQIIYDATRGKISLFDDPQIRAMGEYISRSFVKDGWVVNFADASAKLSFTPSLLYNYGLAVGSQEMKDFAIYNLGRKDKGYFAMPKPVIWNDVYRSLESLKSIVEMTGRVEQLNARIDAGETYDSCLADLRSSLPAVTWYPETEFCYVKNSVSDWFFAVKGGHNNESHNHNDIGTFILYKGGVPVFVDAGVGTYTKQTFSGERYNIWSMQSAWHNLPVINGKTQKNGAQYRSADVKVSSKGNVRKFSLDIARAYRKGTDCSSWIREYKITDKQLIITDMYQLISRNDADVENFLVQGEVYMTGEILANGYMVKEGEVVVENQGVAFRLVYPEVMTPSVTVKELDDPRLSNVWGTSLRRISFTGLESAPLNGKYIFKISEL